MSRLAGEREIFARTSERSRRMRRRGMAARGDGLRSMQHPWNARNRWAHPRRILLVREELDDDGESPRFEFESRRVISLFTPPRLSLPPEEENHIDLFTRILPRSSLASVIHDRDYDSRRVRSLPADDDSTSDKRKQFFMT